MDICPCIPARYALALVSCLGFINVYILRVNLSVAVVQMDASTATVTNTSARVRARVHKNYTMRGKGGKEGTTMGFMIDSKGEEGKRACI